MQNVLPIVEKALEPFRARPHWGKLFAMPRERVEELYGGAIAEFRSAMQRYDPEGRFRNAWIEETIGVPSTLGSHVDVGECRGLELAHYAKTSSAFSEFGAVHAVRRAGA